MASRGPVNLGAVLFDMDGLMLDTEPLAARAWSEAARTMGVAFDHAVTGRLVGRNFADCERLILAHHGDDYPVAALMQQWHATYDDIVATEGIALKPGLLELLAWLDVRAIPRAVATSTRRSRAMAKLRQTGLLERFTTLVGGDEVPRGKPAPDIFVEAAARLDALAVHCVVLEDSEPGVEAALAGGMRAIMVPDLHPAPASFRERDVVVVDSLFAAKAELEALLAFR